MSVKWAQLFTKLLYGSPGEVTFRDIQEFCQELPESDQVEYKGWRTEVSLSDFAEKLIREAVAMANTDGGLIIVGVGEEKDEPGGGRRDYPGNVSGLPLTEANRLRQSIEDKCLKMVKPSWCPEILVLNIRETTDRVLLLVRVDPDKVERPLLFCRADTDGKEKCISLVRLNKQVVAPTWEEIVKIAEGRIDRDFDYQVSEAWRNMSANSEPFVFCSLGVALCKRRYAEPNSWDDTEVRELIKAIRGHRLQINGSTISPEDVPNFVEIEVAVPEPHLV